MFLLTCVRVSNTNLHLSLTSYTLYQFHIRGETSHAESEETQTVTNPEEIDIDEDDDDDDDDDEPGTIEVFFHYLMIYGGEGRAALLE